MKYFFDFKDKRLSEKDIDSTTNIKSQVQVKVPPQVQAPGVQINQPLGVLCWDNYLYLIWCTSIELIHLRALSLLCEYGNHDDGTEDARTQSSRCVYCGNLHLTGSFCGNCGKRHKPGGPSGAADVVDVDDVDDVDVVDVESGNAPAEAFDLEMDVGVCCTSFAYIYQRKYAWQKRKPWLFGI